MGFNSAFKGLNRVRFVGSDFCGGPGRSAYVVDSAQPHTHTHTHTHTQDVAN